MRRAGATLPGGAQASHCGGFSCCRARALGMRASVVVARGLSSCGSWALEHRFSSCGAWALAAPWHVGSSQTRARTCVPCIGRRILNHCTTREAAGICFAFFPHSPHPLNPAPPNLLAINCPLVCDLSTTLHFILLRRLSHCFLLKKKLVSFHQAVSSLKQAQPYLPWNSQSLE